MAENTIDELPIDDDREDFSFDPSDVLINVDLERQKKEARDKAKKLREESNYTTKYIITLDNLVKSIDELTKDEKLIEYGRCALDPIYFIETYLTIFDQTKNMIVPFKLFEFQKDLIADYMYNRFNVANKYRQAGISTTTCAYITWYVMFTENAKVAVVANKLDTARDELMSDIIEFIEQCPEFLIPKQVKGDKKLKDAGGHKKFIKGREIKAFAPNTLRGLTPTLIFWDEAAWAQHGFKFWESARPTLQTGGGAIFVSTPNGLDQVFYETIEKSPKNGFHSILLWWYNDPRYIVNEKGEIDLEWVKDEGTNEEKRIKDDNFDKAKRKDLIDKGFTATSSWFEKTKRGYNGNDRQLAQELLCSFLGSGDNFVGEENIRWAVENTVTPYEEKKKVEWTDKNMWVWEEPLPDTTYVIGIDIGKGSSDDFSCLSIGKVIPREENITYTNYKNEKKTRRVKRRLIEQVAEYYGKVRPEIMADIAFHYGRAYNNALIVIDITGGYGTTTVVKLTEFGYNNLYYSETNNKDRKGELNSFVKWDFKERGGEMKEVDLYPGLTIGGNRGSILITMAEK